MQHVEARCRGVRRVATHTHASRASRHERSSWRVKAGRFYPFQTVHPHDTPTPTIPDIRDGMPHPLTCAFCVPPAARRPPAHVARVGAVIDQRPLHRSRVRRRRARRHSGWRAGQRVGVQAVNDVIPDRKELVSVARRSLARGQTSGDVAGERFNTRGDMGGLRKARVRFPRRSASRWCCCCPVLLSE